MNTLKTIGVLTAFLASLPAMAQGDDPDLRPGFSSEIEAGWTSNADGRAHGRGGLYLGQSQTLSALHNQDDFALRASLSLQSMEYPGLEGLGERSIAAEIETEAAVGPATWLRGAFAADFGEQSETLPLATGLLAIETARLKTRASVEIAHGFSDLMVLAGVNYQARLFGESRFAVPGLAPERLSPDLGLAAANLSISQAHGPVRAGAGVAVQRALVSDADSRRFGRIGATHVRGFGTIALDAGPAALAIDAGADLLVSDIGRRGDSLRPYVEAELELAPTEATRFSFGVESRTDIEDPGDGLADHVLGVRAGLGLRLGPVVQLDTSVFAEYKRSAALDIAFEERRGTEIGLDLLLGDIGTFGARLAHTRVSGLAQRYEDTRIGLMLRAAL